MAREMACKAHLLMLRYERTVEPALVFAGVVFGVAFGVVQGVRQYRRSSARLFDVFYHASVGATLGWMWGKTALVIVPLYLFGGFELFRSDKKQRQQ